MNEDTTGKGTSMNPLTGGTIPYSEWSRADWTNQFYGEYKKGRLQIDSEYRRYVRDQVLFGGAAEDAHDVRGWYVSGTYRIANRFALGSYYSRYTITSLFRSTFGPPISETDTSLPGNHGYDKVITARIDLTKFWNVKVEGHFMNGYGAASYPDGFYPQVNPEGFKPNTNALVLKTSFNF
jgi:hypothetical protein